MLSNIIVLDNEENFLKFLDPDLIDLEETFENGLRSIEVTYNIDDILDSQQLFKPGNKIWVSGDGNITPCLYVLNTKVKQDIYKGNKYSFTAEDVLVELNYAPYISQTDITSANGFTTSNGKVKVNYNALHFWFGDYFNIDVVQDCISSYTSLISVSGTMNPMSLLRYIEEETGNIFVTRYEKDILNNTIHRYLAFLNPVNENKNWELHFEYDFLEATTTEIFDEDGEPTTDDTEDVYEPDDEVTFIANAPVVNVNPTNLLFRITDGMEVLNTHGSVYDEDDETQVPLEWNAEDLGLTSQTPHVTVSLKYIGYSLGIKIQTKQFNVVDDDTLTGISDSGYITNVWSSSDYQNNISMVNGCYFEFYDTSSEKIIFRHKIDSILSDAHEDILDFGRNVENVEFEVDESDTFTAISPVLSLDNNSGASNSLNYDDMAKIVTAWKNLSVTKGATIPMIVQKMSITGTDQNPCTQRTGTASSGRSAEEILGTYALASNYYKRPVKPTDNTENTNKSYEYWVGTAYWSAPFTKNAGELFVSAETTDNRDYPNITGRPDSRNSRAVKSTPKCGPVETSEEDVYAIYNAVAMKLKEKKDPLFNITTEVANLKDGKFNQYNVHDIVFLKLPTFDSLVTAKVVKTVKNLHNIAENQVTLANYSVTSKEITTETYISASNVTFKYPNSKTLTVTLKDIGDGALANKLVTFTLYKIENDNATLTRKVYTKKTNSSGQASITLKYNPGQYQMEIQFGGDVRYAECKTTIQISVGGTKDVNKTSSKTTTKSKTTKGYKIVKTFYDKWGRSPDKKTILGVGLPSRSSELRKYGYKFMKTPFKNYCPVCGEEGTLYYGWNFGTYFRGRREGGSVEGLFRCEHCDADFSAINGENHNRTGKPSLIRLDKPVKSSKAEAKKLVNGKIQYGTKKVKETEKNIVDGKTRSNPIGSVDKYVKQKALSIVGNSVGIAAAKKIADFMGRNIKYDDHCNFLWSSKTVLLKGRGNCCEQTRCMLEMMDAAGCAEYITMKYVFVCCSPKGIGHVFAKIITKSNNNWRYVDPCKTNSWGNYVKGWGSPPGRQTSYPTKPF